MADRFATPASSPEELHLIDGYVGRGYALSTPEELDLIRHVASREGILLDPVYTGKAFNGMIQTLKKNPSAFGQRVLFLHTGGVFALFAKAGTMSSPLAAD